MASFYAHADAEGICHWSGGAAGRGRYLAGRGAYITGLHSGDGVQNVLKSPKNFTKNT